MPLKYRNRMSHRAPHPLLPGFCRERLSRVDAIHAGNPYPNRVLCRVTSCLTPIILLFAILIPFSELHAQSGGFSGNFTRMGFGPRGMAMGNAMGTVTSEGIYAHYNPALASFVNNTQIELGTAIMAFDRSLHNLSATFSLPPSAGLNIGLINANVDNIDGRNTSGYHTDYLSTNEFQFFTAFGIALSERIRIGASVKLHLANYHNSLKNASGAGFDLGMIAEPLANWRIGLSVQDLLSEYSWNTVPIYGTQGGRNRSDAFPVRLRLGSSYYLAKYHLLISSEMEWQIQRSEYVEQSAGNDILPPQNRSSATTLTGSSTLLRFGAAWKAHERFTIRAGWEVTDLEYLSETHKISTGFSIHLPYDALKPSVDYAYVHEAGGIPGMHVMALRLTLQ